MFTEWYFISCCNITSLILFLSELKKKDISKATSKLEGFIPKLIFPLVTGNMMRTMITNTVEAVGAH